MASRCDRCHKGNQRGKNIARARQGLNYRTSKTFKPNLHAFRALIDGRRKKLHLCTKCLRIVKGEQLATLKKQAELKAKRMAENLKKKKVKKTKAPVKKVTKKTREEKKVEKAKKDAKKVAKTKEKVVKKEAKSDK